MLLARQVKAAEAQNKLTAEQNRLLAANTAAIEAQATRAAGAIHDLREEVRREGRDLNLAVADSTQVSKDIAWSINLLPWAAFGASFNLALISTYLSSISSAAGDIAANTGTMATRGGKMLMSLRSLIRGGLQVGSRSAGAAMAIASYTTRGTLLAQLSPSKRTIMAQVEKACGPDVADSLLYGFFQVDANDLSGDACKNAVRAYQAGNMMASGPELFDGSEKNIPSSAPRLESTTASDTATVSADAGA